MSVTFHIYKPVEGVEYTSSWRDQFSLKEIDQAMKEDNNYILEGPKNEAEDKTYCWSDHKEHIAFDLYDFQSGFDKKLERRMVKKIKRIVLPFKCGLRNKNYPYKIIPVDEIAYSHGWFLRRRFLSKKNPMYIAVSKEQMMSFFKKYGTIPKHTHVIDYIFGGIYKKVTNDLGLTNTMEQFEKAFEPGCIFVAEFYPYKRRP